MNMKMMIVETMLTSREICCFSGYAGLTCNIEIDECQSNPCQFGGVCMDKVGKFQCQCTPGETLSHT